MQCVATGGLPACLDACQNIWLVCCDLVVVIAFAIYHVRHCLRCLRVSVCAGCAEPASTDTVLLVDPEKLVKRGKKTMPAKKFYKYLEVSTPVKVTPAVDRADAAATGDMRVYVVV